MQLERYQIEGAAWLARRNRGLLADEMGLGKTVQAIMAARRLELTTINIICPALVRFVWAHELDKWWPGHPEVHLVLKRKDPVPRTGIVICSYDATLNDATTLELVRRQPQLTIFDESHYLKTRNSKRTEAAFGRYASGNTGIGKASERVWCLSGTPAPNDPSELFPMLRFFGAYQSTYAQFVERYFNYYVSDYGIKVTGVRDKAAFKELIEPWILRRRKTEVLSQLPPLRVSTLTLEGDFAGEAAYLKDLPRATRQHIEKALETEDWRMLNVPHIASMRRIIGLAKVPSIVELVNYELANGLDKIAIFAQHIEVINKLRAYIKGARAIVGATAPHDRKEILDSFEAGKFPCLILQIDAASTGVTLASCSNCLLAEPSWTPATNEQAIARFHRIGQHKPVHARFVSLAGSIDEAIVRVLSRKTQTLSQVLA